MTVWLCPVKPYSYRNAAASKTVKTVEIPQFCSEKKALDGLTKRGFFALSLLAATQKKLIAIRIRFGLKNDKSRNKRR